MKVIRPLAALCLLGFLAEANAICMPQDTLCVPAPDAPDTSPWDLGATPAPADYDGDGRTDVAFKTSSGKWFIDLTHDGFRGWNSIRHGYGDASCVPVPADYDGDGKADLSVKCGDGSWLVDYASSPNDGWNVQRGGYGDASNVPVPADYDGDGRADFSVKAANGMWFIDYASSPQDGWNVQRGGYGDASGTPAPADYDGDGRADFSIKGANGVWFIDHAASPGDGWNVQRAGYGASQCRPVPADYDGDGRADLSTFCSDGTWRIDYAASPQDGWNVTVGGYGTGAIPVAGDYDGDDRSDIATVADTRRSWHIDFVANGFSSWDLIARDSSSNSPPPVGDNDRDGLVDAQEDRLLRKFAPQIWLHHDENRWPVNVPWLLARSTLRYSHSGCSDHAIIAQGNVTAANITQHTHRDAHNPATNPPWDACQHHGTANRSDGHTGDTKNTFFLQFAPDSVHNGSSSPGDWTLYGHVYPVGGGRIVLQYWQLYAFNDSFASANHEGDWEYTAVVIDSQEEPQKLVFFRHGHAREALPEQVEWVGTHHVAYSSKGGHAQYRGSIRLPLQSPPGAVIPDHCVDADLQGFADNCDAGTAWNSWLNGFGGIVNMGELSHPLNNSNWLRYSGLWGEVGNAAVVIQFTSGPRGPAYQNANWHWRP